jgi:hypothetical protein
MPSNSPAICYCLAVPNPCSPNSRTPLTRTQVDCTHRARKAARSHTNLTQTTTSVASRQHGGTGSVQAPAYRGGWYPHRSHRRDTTFLARCCSPSSESVDKTVLLQVRRRVQRQRPSSVWCSPLPGGQTPPAFVGLARPARALSHEEGGRRRPAFVFAREPVKAVGRSVLLDTRARQCAAVHIAANLIRRSGPRGQRGSRS